MVVPNLPTFGSSLPISHVASTDSETRSGWIKTPMAPSFNGHTVVVTGAGGGLGKAYAYSSLRHVYINNQVI